MTQFMKNIVQEVLNRNKTEAQGTVSPPTEPAPPRQQIPGIHRPNYQRQKQQERLSVGSSVKPNAETAAAKASESPPKLSKEFMENQISALQRVTTANAITGSSRVEKSGLSGREQGAQLVGKTRNHQFVWFFPSSSNRFSSIAYGDSTGMITGVSDNPGTLFLLDTSTKSAANVSCGVYGEKKANGLPDVVKIHSKDPVSTLQLLKEIYHQLNRPSVRSIESYLSEKPSRFLLECLNLANESSVGLLAGVSNISGMALLDRYFKANPQASFQFDLRDNFLLVSGPYSVVDSVIRQLEKDAEKLLM